MTVEVNLKNVCTEGPSVFDVYDILHGSLEQAYWNICGTVSKKLDPDPVKRSSKGIELAL